MKPFLPGSKLFLLILCLIIFTVPFAKATKYYSSITGTDISFIASWTSKSDGSVGGTAPSNFTNAADTFIIRSGSTLALTSWMWTIAGFFQNNGTLWDSATLSLPTAINIGGNWINNGGAFNPTIYTTVTFNGTANQVIGGTSANTFNNLIINPSAGITVSISTNSLVVNSNLTVSSGIFDLGILNCNRASTGGTFTLAANAMLRLANNTGGPAGSNFPNNFTTNTLNAISTVEYYGVNNINQTVYAVPIYGNLNLINGSGTGTANKTSTAAISALGATTINASANFTLGAGFTTGTSFSIYSAGKLNCAANVVSGAVLQVAAIQTKPL